MELDYSIEPSLFRKWKPVFQNWRLGLFVLVIAIPFAWVGYTLYHETVTKGIQLTAGNVYEVDLKSLGNFPFNELAGKPTDIPEDFRKLDGKRVRLSGKMYAGGGVYEAANFQLVYDIAKCCFSGPPKVQERVFVHVPNEQKIAIYGADQMVVITGVLRVRLQRDALGTIVSVYDMDIESLKPAT